MTAATTLALRREELGRRVEALPEEVKRWRVLSTTSLDMDVHFSQLLALEVLVEALVDKQRAALQDLDPEGSPEAFSTAAFDLVQQIIKSQRVWDFFRDKLELRFSPDFRDILWITDTIAWDCYRPVMDRAVAAGIVPAAEVREPPLTYLTAEFSPATWVRGSRPNDGRNYSLGTSTLPIPVIEVPWDHLGNTWELVSLHHEVAHDLEVDLKLRTELLDSLRTALSGAGVPDERIRVWLSWEGETFADLVGIRLGGPPFAHGLMHLLILPSSMVKTYNPSDPHPTHLLRILLNAAYVRTLACGNDAVVAQSEAIRATWLELYGQPSSALQPFVADFEHVFNGLTGSPLTALGGRTVNDLIPYTAADDIKIRAAAGYLETGLDAPAPLSLPPRHAISGARMAAAAVIERAAADAAYDLADAFGTLNSRLFQLVRDGAPPGLRASDSSDRHKRFIAGFADAL
jgi:hypothetical protein